ncbi:PAS sensor protein [Nitzschia inconspicua]|uniref:PAS sensor protein n=1 Tax=Nitzschia inconspicua TaxID=303405 RepID=A0A9K3M166_9STRA|nr:PAS sensor protein [Nitzschia inconspicua]
MDQEDVLRELSATKDEFLKMALQRYRPILACYIGDYASGAALAMKGTDKCCKMLPGQPAAVIVRFCSALCCYAMALLLSAELDAVSGKIALAFKKFERVITMAGRCGIVQDQALANERYADSCLEQGDQEEYNLRMNAAIRLYMEWGAFAKVDKLRVVLDPFQRGGRIRSLLQDTSSIQSFRPMDRILDDEEKLREIEKEVSIRGFTSEVGSSHPFVSR